MHKIVHISDTELVSDFQNGNLGALEILIERHKQRVFDSIIFLVKDKHTADDIFQETLTRVIIWLRSDRYREEGKVLPWILRISHNLCLDHFRRKKRIPLIMAVEDGPDDIIEFRGEGDRRNAETELICQETYALINRLLELLPPPQREVLVLRHYADMSFKQIAYITNCSINTALGRMRYGLLNLRSLLEKHGIEL